MSPSPRTAGGAASWCVELGCVASRPRPCNHSAPAATSATTAALRCSFTGGLPLFFLSIYAGTCQRPPAFPDLAVSREKSDILSPVKKKCVSCGKQIPSVALNCVFCSSRQPAPDFSDIDVLRDAVDRARTKSEAHAVV